jgi:hypothetical protein
VERSRLLRRRQVEGATAALTFSRLTLTSPVVGAQVIAELGHGVEDVTLMPGQADSPRRCARLITTMIYTHVLNRGPAGVRSPLDR